MLDFVAKLTTTSHLVEESDRDALRQQGFTEEDIWDIVEVAGFYNMSNRIASGIGLIPNQEYHPSYRKQLVTSSKLTCRPEDFQETKKKQQEEEEEEVEEEAEEEEEVEEKKPVAKAHKPAPKAKSTPSKSAPASKKGAQKTEEKKKAANPYILFVKDKLPTLDDMPKPKAMQELGRLWKALSPQEKKVQMILDVAHKQVYQDRAAGKDS